ncbi:MAG: hypothetical protein WC740_15510 [Verrucomicrobiia bacterium]
MSFSQCVCHPTPEHPPVLHVKRIRIVSWYPLVVEFGMHCGKTFQFVLFSRIPFVEYK